MGLGVRDNEWEERSVPPIQGNRKACPLRPASGLLSVGEEGYRSPAKRMVRLRFFSLPVLPSYPFILTFSSPSGPQVKQLLGAGDGDHRGPGVSLGVVPHVSIAPLRACALKLHRHPFSSLASLAQVGLFGKPAEGTGPQAELEMHTLRSISGVPDFQGARSRAENVPFLKIFGGQKVQLLFPLVTFPPAGGGGERRVWEGGAGFQRPFSHL